MVGKKIRDIRRSKGISRKELADYLGVPKEKWAMYERDYFTIRLNKLIKVAEFLHVDLDYLLDGSKTADYLCAKCQATDNVVLDKKLSFVTENYKLEYYSKDIENALCFDCILEGLKAMGGHLIKEEKNEPRV